MSCQVEVSPKVVPTHRESTITIRPLYQHCALRPGQEVEILVIPMEHLGATKTPCAFDLESIAQTLGTIPAQVEASGVQFTYAFEAEQEHLIYILQMEQGRRKELLSLRVYAIEDDLYQRWPYKGDLHIHSNRSDGREEPAYVAGACRRMGLDFFALTDHGQYTPSLEAQAAFPLDEMDFRIFPGEEVHAPGNPVHIINFGGEFSVNELFRQNPAQYQQEVEELITALGPFPDSVSGSEYASCHWVFQKIREGGGLGIFSHPYWLIPSGYSPSTPLTALLFERQPFDAFEVIGGYYKYQVDSNTLQVARYHEERSKGRDFPVVGVSDAHGCETGTLFGWYYSLVFSPSSDLPEIISSIKAGYSVAVERMEGESVRVYGPFRLVKFALFALRELFDLHDELCRTEGSLMLRSLAGDGQARQELIGLKGQTPRAMARYWRR